MPRVGSLLKPLRFAVVLLLCVAVCGGLLAQAEPMASEEEKIRTEAAKVVLTTSYSKSVMTYSGTTFELQGNTGTSLMCNLYTPNIIKDGVAFTGVSQSDSTIWKTINITLTNAIVTDATIKMRNYLPENSNFSITGTTATMKGSTTLFDLTAFIPGNGVVVYIQDTTATWTTGPGGVVLLLVGTGVHVLMRYNSGFYLLRTTAVGARSMVKLDGDCTPPEKFDYCFDMYAGILAVDYATCTDCTGPFMDAGLQPVANSRLGFYRFQNCTHHTKNGDQPFLYSNVPEKRDFRSLVFGPNGNVIFSAIDTNGPLFNLLGPRGQAHCKVNTQYIFQHIKAKSFGTYTGNFFVIKDAQCDVYVGNVTLDNEKYTTEEQYDTLKIAYTKILGDHGTVDVLKAKTATDSATKPGDYSSAYCTRSGLYDDPIGEEMPSQEIVDEYAKENIQLERWFRSNCTCHVNTFRPYCTVVYDPLLYPQGYTFQTPKCETDEETCEECKWGFWDQCTKCKPYYEFDDNGKCVPTKCVTDYCALCEENSATKCKTCTGNYVLTADKKCVKPTNSTGNVEPPEDAKGLSTGAIVGIAVGCAAFLLLLLFLILFFCCCMEFKEMHVVYQQGYNDDEEEEYADRELRAFNGGSGVFSRVVVVSDQVKPFVYKQDDRSVHGDQESFARGPDNSEDYSSSESSEVYSSDGDEGF